MNQSNATPQEGVERAHETAEARAELLRLAEEQGVSPVTNFDDLLGEPGPEDEGDDNIEELLRNLREWRETPSTRSIE